MIIGYVGIWQLTNNYFTKQKEWGENFIKKTYLGNSKHD